MKNLNSNNINGNIPPAQLERIRAAIEDELTIHSNSDEDFDFDVLEHDPYHSYTVEENNGLER